MSSQTQNLGQVKAIHIGTSSPSNTTMLWYDSNVNKHKYYDTVSGNWILLSSNGGSNGYQSTEHLTGVNWINAKPVYRQVFTNTFNPSSSNTIQEILFSNIGIVEETIDLTVFLKSSSGNWSNFDAVLAQNILFKASAIIESSGSTVSIAALGAAQGTSPLANFNSYVMIAEYTKI